MAKEKKPVVRTAKTDGFVVGRNSFEKISAVEGIEMTAAMKRHASDARAKGLTAEEYRRIIIGSHRKG
jgi:hypothetical protein